MRNLGRKGIIRRSLSSIARVWVAGRRLTVTVSVALRHLLKAHNILRSDETAYGIGELIRVGQDAGPECQTTGFGGAPQESHVQQVGEGAGPHVGAELGAVDKAGHHVSAADLA